MDDITTCTQVEFFTPLSLPHVAGFWSSNYPTMVTPLVAVMIL